MQRPTTSPTKTKYAQDQPSTSTHGNNCRGQSMLERLLEHVKRGHLGTRMLDICPKPALRQHSHRYKGRHSMVSPASGMDYIWSACWQQPFIHPGTLWYHTVPAHSGQSL
jgi:hypothetical protein